MSNSLAKSSVEAFASKAGIPDTADYSVAAGKGMFVVATAEATYHVAFKKDGQDTVGFTSNQRHDVTREEARDLLVMIKLKLTTAERAQYDADLTRLSTALPNLGFRNETPAWHSAPTHG